MRRPAHTPRWLDAGIALAAFAGSVAFVAASESHVNEVDAASITLAGLASLPLIARRRAPLVVFVVTGIAATVLRLVADPAGPPVGPTIALFGLAETTSRPGQPRALAVVLSVFAAHLAATAVATDRFPAAELLFGVLLWGGTWLAGERTRLRRERMAELEERAERAEREAERERRLAAAEQRMRIARDLHDSAGHAINVILVHAGLGRLNADRDPAAARAAFETIEEVARETVGEIDQLVRVLREDHDHGGADGVEPPPGIAALDGLMDRHRAAGLAVTAAIRGDRRALAPSTDRAAYRIVQEALTNAARHGVGRADVEVAYDADALDVTVANPLGPDWHRNDDGHGITGMRERAALLGGSLVAGPRDGRFEVRARLPLT